MNLFARFKLPDSILLDNGTQFISKLTTQVTAMFQIKHKFCSCYHPAVNGLCKNFNGVLKHLLGKVTYDHPEDKHTE